MKFCKTQRLVGALILSGSGLLWAQPQLSLQAAVHEALRLDLGVLRYRQQATSAREGALAAQQLPDPKLSLGLNNFPTDSFDTDQEPMTQIRFGLSQTFPAGDTRALRSAVAALDADTLGQRAELRRHQVVQAARLRWLDAYYWQQALGILEADRGLFDQLLTITQSLFAVGKRQQQDLLRAELEISRLQERLMVARESARAARARLSRWAGDGALAQPLPARLPSLDLLPRGADSSAALRQHPRLRQLRKAVDRSQTMVRLAEQQYKPRVSVDLGYGYRDGDNLDGSNRADFASLMVSVELPLFSHQRQDRQVAAQVALHGSEQAHFDDALREQLAALRAEQSHFRQLQTRRKWFEDDVLKKSAAQTQATLNAYQSDTADFADVMRAYLSAQTTQLDYQRLRVDEQKALATLHFLAATPLPAVPEAAITP